MSTVIASVHSQGIAIDLRAPVDITLPYGAHRASEAAAATAADRRDVKTGPERAGDRSIYPACGCVPNGAVVGAHRGDRGATENAVVNIHNS